MGDKEMNITGMLAVGNGESCPFCKGKEKFVNQPDIDFVGHLQEKHPKEFMNALFGDDK